jgi:hypothetical protein
VRRSGSKGRESVVDEVKPQSRKWKLFPVFAWSLLIGFVLFALRYSTDGGTKITYMLSHPQGVGGIVGELLSLPIFCTIIAMIRNLFVK